jgi:hypothetical protein
VCSQQAGEEGERLVEGGKKEDLKGLRKGQQQRYDERFADSMD